MNIVYTRNHGLTPEQLRKIEGKFGKLAKMVERNGEREARVILKTERHLHHAEITMNLYDHPIVAMASDGDRFTAIAGAVEKMEAQAKKLMAKWRGTHRGAKAETVRKEPVGKAKAKAKSGAGAAEAPPPVTGRVFRVNHQSRRKPMTLEEAVLEMESGAAYVAYRDADRDCTSVLIRRQDGNFDLIES
ncbi:MAG: HPF/RaiA family ribosome-associated protein [Bryobacteraceae bacterium]|nr:HPF/RaiA family ribosome-associated protein [Bryobacteraceae bacterium]